MTVLDAPKLIPGARGESVGRPAGGDAATAPGDNELMALMRDGSREALAELYVRYCDRALLVARAVCLDDAQAEEAVQEGFVSIWNSRATYRPDRPTPAPWLLTVVRHRAIDLRRRHATYESHRVSDRTLRERRARDDVATEAVRRLEARDLQALLGGLPETQREVIFLAFYAELTHYEIAARLGLQIGTVKGRVRLGLHKLRTAVERPAAY